MCDRPWRVCLLLLGALSALPTACGTDVVSEPPDMLSPPSPPAPPPPPVSPALVISEIMYHPAEEDAAIERHEFVEIHNRTDAAIELLGWRLSGEISYKFPSGASIPPFGYRVIAKDRAALAEISEYRLDPKDVLGDYDGALDNGGGTLRLVDPSDKIVDSVTYDDGFPWPIGADALGADDDWLALLPSPTTTEAHKYKGRSLERISFEVPGDTVANWAPSPLDGATPGRANSKRGAPPTIVERKTLTWSGTDSLIRATDTVKISVALSSFAKFSGPRLQYFVDNVQITGEPITTVDMTLKDGLYEASLPPQPDNSIVRYRIQVDQGSGPEVISPRPSDPLGWWAYFVSPKVETTAPIYHLFLKKEDWNQIYDNVNFGTDDRRVSPGGSPANRCALRPSWNGRVPAVLVHDGVVYDAFVRYEGSRWNRTNGVTLDAKKTTINPLPDRPNPYRVLSFRVRLPDYAKFEGQREHLVLNKLNQSCPGLDNTVGERLYGDKSIGIPVQRGRYFRLHVNGGYYHYMLDLEHIDADMMKRYRTGREPVGDLYKADGHNGGDNQEGPWGRSDGSLLNLNPDCPQWTLEDRYAFTYERVTNKWRDMSALRKLIEDVNALRAAAVGSGDWTAVRDYFKANFDYQKILDYIVIRNWAEPWDDTFHNYFLYQRASDGKWLLIPQDLDLEFSEFYTWSTGRSFFVGEEGDIEGRGWHRIKDAFIKAFRAEMWQRLVDLTDSGVLSPPTYAAKVDEAAATFSLADYAASPAVNACDFNAELARKRNFATCRQQDLSEIVDAASCTSETCGLMGEYYETAAGDTTRDFALATLLLTRKDANVNFEWGAAPPASMLPSDGFQVRWTGVIKPSFSETYTFYVRNDDGVRLFVDGALVVNRWNAASAAELSGTADLTAGVPATITLEYFDATGGASVRLLWSSPSHCKQIIPTTRFAPM